MGQVQKYLWEANQLLIHGPPLNIYSKVRTGQKYLWEANHGQSNYWDRSEISIKMGSCNEKYIWMSNEKYIMAIKPTNIQHKEDVPRPPP